MWFMVGFVVAGLYLAGVSHGEGSEGDDEERLEEVVVTGTPRIFGATKSEVPLLEAPRSLSIITEEDFNDFGALAFSNALTYTSGVTGNAFGPSTRGDFTYIRGLDAPQYLDNSQVLFGYYNNARTEIYTLEQIEVLKGPASVLYGQAAPGGIVSAISKIAGPDRQGRDIVASGGTHNRYQGSADLGFDLSGDGVWTARFVGVVRAAGTQVDFVEDNALIVAPSMTYATERTVLTALFNYTYTDGDANAQFLPLAATGCGSAEVTISEPNVCAGASGRKVDVSTYVGSPTFNRYDTRATTLTFLATHELNETIRFEGTARYRDNDAKYDQTWLSFLGDGNRRIRPDGTAIGRTWYSAPAGSTQLAIDARLRVDFVTWGLGHEILGGVNYQDVKTRQRSARLNAATSFNIFNPVYDGSEIPEAAALDAVRGMTEDQTVATDVYITDHMIIGNLVFNAGFRFSSVDSRDSSNSQSDRETPISIGALYKTSFGLNPYFSYSESFRATVGTDVNTEFPLKPRKGKQIEAGFKYNPPGSQSYLIVSYFDLEENNLIDFVAGGRTQPGLTIESTGVEVEALLGLGDFRFDFDFRVQDAREVDENGMSQARPSDPDVQASLWSSWRPGRGRFAGLRAGAGVRYQSERESNGTAFLVANGSVPTPIRVVTDSIAVFDAMIGYEFDRIDLSLNLRNLTGEEYYGACLSRGDCFPAEGRTVILRAVCRFD